MWLMIIYLSIATFFFCLSFYILSQKKTQEELLEENIELQFITFQTYENLVIFASALIGVFWFIFIFVVLYKIIFD